MLGTYSDFGGTSVLEYFRPIVDMEHSAHANFGMHRAYLGRYFAGECVAILELLLQADKEMQKFYEQTQFEVCDDLFCVQASAYMKEVLIYLRAERLPETESLKLEFRTICNLRINTPDVIEANKHVIIVNLQNANAKESHYLTFAFVKGPTTE